MTALRQFSEVIKPPPYKSGDRLPSRVMQRPSTNLGFMYNNGGGVPENDAESVK